MEWQILFVDRVFDLLTHRMVDSFVIRIIDLLGQYKYKLNAQFLRLIGLHSDVNDAHRAGANRLQNKTKSLSSSVSSGGREPPSKV